MNKTLVLFVFLLILNWFHVSQSTQITIFDLTDPQTNNYYSSGPCQFELLILLESDDVHVRTYAFTNAQSAVPVQLGDKRAVYSVNVTVSLGGVLTSLYIQPEGIATLVYTMPTSYDCTALPTLQLTSPPTLSANMAGSHLLFLQFSDLSKRIDRFNVFSSNNYVIQKGDNTFSDVTGLVVNVTVTNSMSSGTIVYCTVDSQSLPAWTSDLFSSASNNIAQPDVQYFPEGTFTDQGQYYGFFSLNDSSQVYMFGETDSIGFSFINGRTFPAYGSPGNATYIGYTTKYNFFDSDTQNTQFSLYQFSPSGYDQVAVQLMSNIASDSIPYTQPRPEALRLRSELTFTCTINCYGGSCMNDVCTCPSGMSYDSMTDTCVTNDPCALVSCTVGSTCNSVSGLCEATSSASVCDSIVCSNGFEICDSSMGVCYCPTPYSIDEFGVCSEASQSTDPCQYVTCQFFATCNMGSCDCQPPYQWNANNECVEESSNPCPSGCPGNSYCSSGSCICDGSNEWDSSGNCIDPNSVCQSLNCQGYAVCNAYSQTCDCNSPYIYNSYSECIDPSTQDPCASVTCSGLEQCVSGSCQCFEPNYYNNGNCEPDNCYNSPCPSICDQSSGSCVCLSGQYWNQADGTCVTDVCTPCTSSGGFCSGGVCTCPANMTLDSKNNCVDVNECMVYAPCSSPATCVDLPNGGGYLCQCPQNLIPAGNGCYDPCSDTTYCGSNTDCQVNNYVVQCTCSEGYQNMTGSCNPIDHCTDDPSPCVNGSCAYTGPGYYQCSCSSDMYLDGNTCLPYHNCSTNVCEQVCNNTSPYQSVCSCNTGFYLASDNSSCILISPQITFIEYLQSPTNGDQIVVKIDFNYMLPIIYIDMINSKFNTRFSPADLVSGNTTIGTFEKQISAMSIGRDDFSFTIVGSDQQSSVYNRGIISVGIRTPAYPTKIFFNPSDLLNFQIQGNSPDLSNSSQSLQLSFGVNSRLAQVTHLVPKLFIYPAYVASEIKDLDIASQTPVSSYFIGYYDASSQEFVIPFTLPARLFTGNVDYTLVLGSSYFRSSILYQYLGARATLSVTSAFADQFPPLINYISTSPSATITSGQTQTVYFDITVNDNYNGFSSGTVQIVSEDNNIGYWFDITPPTPSDRFNHTYRIAFNVTCPASSQTFKLGRITLQDESGHVSDNSNPYFIHPISVSLPYPETSVSCSDGYVDTLAPTITSLSLSSTTIDVGSNKVQSFTISFSATDDLSGPSTVITPSVVLTDKTDQSSTFQVSCLRQRIGPLVSNYTCTTSNIPYGFGSGAGVSISVTNLYDNYFNLAATSAVDLGNQGFTNSITINNSYQPKISTYTLTSDGSSLILIGNRLPTDSTAGVYLDFGNGYVKATNYSFFTSLQIQLVLPKTGVSFKAKVMSPGTQQTSNIIVYTLPICPMINNIECGGNGNCNRQTLECLCTPPYSGIDCGSQYVIVPPPKTAGNAPAMTSTVESTSNIKPSVTLTYKSDISISAIREVSPTGKVIFEQDLSNQWIKKASADSSVSVYSIQLTGNQSNTTIDVSMKWYTESSTVSFASQDLNMSPSTMKYNVGIQGYIFQTTLSALQLVVTCQFSATPSEPVSLCSKQTFTSSEQSEYIQIQVEDHSLYGRFIKRGIIDGRTSTLSNTYIKSNSTVSLIAINVPYFTQSALLDPDFSVLIDTKPVDQADKDSECTTVNDTSNSKKLTKAQIAGIVIGCIGFFLVAAIVGFSLYWKKYRQSNFILGFRSRLNKLSSKSQFS